MVGRVWQTLDEPRQKNIVGLLCLVAFVLLICSLVTYDSADLSYNQTPPNEKAQNLIGVPGAIVADFLFRFLGVMAYLVPLLFLSWFLSRLRKNPLPRKKDILTRLLGLILLFFTGCSLFHLLGGSATGFERGGLLGAFFSVPFKFFGEFGSYLLLVTLLFVGLILSTEFLFTRIFKSIANYFATYSEKSAARREERAARKEEKRAAKEEARLAKLEAKKEKEEEEEREKLAETSITISIPGPLSGVKPSRKKQKKSGPTIVIAQPGNTEKELNRAATLADEPITDYEFPSLSLLEQPPHLNIDTTLLKQEIKENTEILERTLNEFAIKARVSGVFIGPVITRYEIELPPGVKVNKIVGLADNLALALKSPGHVRILAPIPGKGAVGVEVPNKLRTEVFMREIFSSEEYGKEDSALLRIALGKTIDGQFCVADLAKMPHLLIAGATGSGKSVCMNSIVVSILYNARPDQVKFLMIDPKRVEFSLYRDIPHLLSPVVTDVKKAAAALKWVIIEMEARYNYLSKLVARDIKGYNKKMRGIIEAGERETVSKILPDHLPYIVVLIDELADLMMVARNDIEVLVARLAQMARAVGIHLVIATQRPSVNVITGIIKANFPTRIAFQVSSKVDSRTILDANGAEALLGKGDLLFSSGGATKPVRIQGAFVSTGEVERTTDMIKAQSKPNYLKEDFETEEEGDPSLFDTARGGNSDDANLYREAKRLILDTGSASTSLLQRRLQIGYGRAARILDQMEQEGIVGPPRGSKPREVIRNMNP